MPEELEDIHIESKRTIDIDEFVPRKEIDDGLLAKSNDRPIMQSKTASARLSSWGVPWVYA